MAMKVKVKKIMYKSPKIIRFITYIVIASFLYSNCVYAVPALPASSNNNTLSSTSAFTQPEFLRTISDLQDALNKDTLAPEKVLNIITERITSILKKAGITIQDAADKTIEDLMSYLPQEYIDTHGNSTLMSYLNNLLKITDEANISLYIKKGYLGRRYLYGFIETLILKNCAQRLLQRYLANAVITHEDKKELADYWKGIYENYYEKHKDKEKLPEPRVFNKYLRKLLFSIKAFEEDGLVKFYANINHKQFTIVPKQKGQPKAKLICKRKEPIRIEENKDLSVKGRLRKTGHLEYSPGLHKDSIDELITYRHELFHIAWLNKLKTDREVIEEIVESIPKEKMQNIRATLIKMEGECWARASRQRLLNEALARVWSRRMAGAGGDELEKVLPEGLLDKVIEVLGLGDIEKIKRLDSSYVEETIDMPCDMYYISERNRIAEEERKKKEKDEKERKKKEEEEKKKVKKIKEKLESMSKKLKDKVLNDSELINIYNADFEHDVREIIIKRLGNLSDKGKLDEQVYDIIDDLATALINGIDEMGELEQGKGRFDENDREKLKEWLNEIGIDDLIKDVQDSDTFKPIKEEEQKDIRKAIETDTHQQDVMDLLQEIAPEILNPNTLKSILWVLITFGISSIISYIFGWDMGGIILAMAPLVTTGAGGGGDQAKFPSGSAEKLEKPSDWIEKYTINLSEKAKELTADSIYLHTKMSDIDKVLRQPEHNNLVLVGDPELTSELIENIAIEIERCRRENKKDRLPPAFQDAEILKFNIAAILGDLTQFGKYERTMRDLVKEIINAAKESNKKYIFYFNFQDIAWIHDQRRDLVADISTLFKSILEDTSVPVIGITSEKYYQIFFVDKADNKNMNNLFSRVKLEKLETADIQILINNYLKKTKELYKDILPSDISVKMDLTYTLNRALEIMRDLFKDYNIPVALLEMLDEIITEKIYASFNRDLYKEQIFNKMIKAADELRLATEQDNKELAEFLKELLNRYIERWQKLAETEKEKKPKEIQITFNDIAEKISIRKRIPVSQLVHEKEKKLDGLIPALKEKIVGQDMVIEEIYRKFKEKKQDIADKRLPFGAFAFIGPTGVGKTEVARVLADYYFSGKMVRIDMSEYMEPHAVEKLFGAPPGYLGYEQGGILTNSVRENPFSLILLDEIDKAHPETFQVLNQILGEGKFTDGQGREIDFSNTIIIMTGNVGMQNKGNPALVRLLADIKCRILEGGSDSEKLSDIKELTEKSKEKIGDEDINWNWINSRLDLEIYKIQYEDATLMSMLNELTDYIQERINKKLEDELEKAFKGREIMGRIRAIGGIITFNALTRTDLEKILDIRLKEINEWLKPYKLDLSFSDEVKELLIEEGYNPVMGARPLARAIRKIITSQLADAILYGRIKTGIQIKAELDETRKVKFAEIGEYEDLEKTEEEKISQQMEEILKYIDENKNCTKENVISKLKEVIKYEPVFAKPKGAALLEEEKLKIEIPVDIKEIEKEAKELGSATGADAKALIEQIKEEKKVFEKWINDKFDSLTIKAKKKELPRAFSDPDTLSRFINVLNQKKRNSPFLIGGDTRIRDSLIEYFAQASFNGLIPGYENARILKLNVNEILEYLPGIGMLEECMRRLLMNIEEDDKDKNLKTFIVIDYDELEKTVAKYRPKLNNREEVFNLGFFMIPFMESPVRVIMSSQNKRVQEFEIFHRYFSSVELNPMDPLETKEAFWLSIKDDLEKQVNGSGPKKVTVDFKILEKIIALFQKYLPGEPLMETLLDFLKRIMPEKGEQGKAKEREISSQIDILKQRLGYLRDTGDINKDILIKDEKVLEQVKKIIELKQGVSPKNSLSITEEDVINYLVKTRNAPLERIGVDEWDKLKNLEKNLKSSILYQDEHLDRIIRAVKAGALGLKRKNSPVASLMLSGPTGCGKTETIRKIAESLGYNFISINLSRIKRIEHLSTLIGPPPGYVGYGQNVDEYLTTKVIKNPKSVIIFDEADKALNMEIYGYKGRTLIDILLPIFEDGRLQDSIGQIADFSQCIVVMASNGGINEVYNPAKGMFVQDNEIYKDIANLTKANKDDIENLYTELKQKIAYRVAEYLTRKMRPEMLNRIDENIIFNPLTRDALKGIIKMKLDEFKKRIKKEDNWEMVYENDEVENGLVKYLLYSHFVPEEGARSLEEPIKKYFMGPVKDFIDAGQEKGKKPRQRKMKIGFSDDKINITEDEASAKEEETKLSQAENIVLENIVTGLKGKKVNEELLEEEIAEWLEPRPLVPQDKGKPYPFSDAKEAIKADTNDFWARGKEKTLTPAKIKEVIDTTLSLRGVPFYRDDEAISLRDTVFNWLLAGINIAQRMNLEQVMSENGIYTSGLGERRLKPAGDIYKAYVENADKKYIVELIKEERPKEILFGIQFNTRFTNAVYRQLFTKQWKDDTEIFNYCQSNNLDALYSLISWSNKLRSQGINIEYSIHNDKTTLWVKIPVKMQDIKAQEVKGIRLKEVKTEELPPDSGSPPVSELIITPVWKSNEHKKDVNATVTSLDGKYLFSGSDDTTIKVWDITNPLNPVCKITLDKTKGGHTDSVWTLAVSKDGKCLFSGSKQKKGNFTLISWRINEILSGESLPAEELAITPVWKSNKHKKDVNATVTSLDGKYLFSGSEDKTIKVWDIIDPLNPVCKVTLNRKKGGHTKLVYTLAVSKDGKYLFSGSSDRTLKVWDITNPLEPVCKITLDKAKGGHTDWVLTLAVSLDGNYLFSGSWDKTIKVWDITNPLNPVLKITLDKAKGGHTNWVRTLAVSLDGNYLFSGSWDKTIKVWDITNPLNPVCRITLDEANGGHTGLVYTLAVSEDGKYLFSGSSDGIIKVWDITNPLNPVCKITLDKDKGGHTDAVYTLAISKDGKCLFSGSKQKEGNFTLISWGITEKGIAVESADQPSSDFTDTITIGNFTFTIDTSSNSIFIYEKGSGNKIREQKLEYEILGLAEENGNLIVKCRKDGREYIKRFALLQPATELEDAIKYVLGLFSAMPEESQSTNDELRAKSNETETLREIRDIAIRLFNVFAGIKLNINYDVTSSVYSLGNVVKSSCAKYKIPYAVIESFLKENYSLEGNIFKKTPDRGSKPSENLLIFCDISMNLMIKAGLVSNNYEQIFKELPDYGYNEYEWMKRIFLNFLTLKPDGTPMDRKKISKNIEQVLPAISTLVTSEKVTDTEDPSGFGWSRDSDNTVTLNLTNSENIKYSIQYSPLEKTTYINKKINKGTLETGYGYYIKVETENNPFINIGFKRDGSKYVIVMRDTFYDIIVGNDVSFISFSSDAFSWEVISESECRYRLTIDPEFTELFSWSENNITTEPQPQISTGTPLPLPLPSGERTEVRGETLKEIKDLAGRLGEIFKLCSRNIESQKNYRGPQILLYHEDISKICAKLKIPSKIIEVFFTKNLQWNDGEKTLYKDIPKEDDIKTAKSILGKLAKYFKSVSDISALDELPNLPVELGGLKKEIYLLLTLGVTKERKRINANIEELFIRVPESILKPSISKGTIPEMNITMTNENLPDDTEFLFNVYENKIFIGRKTIRTIRIGIYTPFKNSEKYDFQKEGNPLINVGISSDGKKFVFVIKDSLYDLIKNDNDFMIYGRSDSKLKSWEVISESECNYRLTIDTKFRKLFSWSEKNITTEPQIGTGTPSPLPLPSGERAEVRGYALLKLLLLKLLSGQIEQTSALPAQDKLQQLGKLLTENGIPEDLAGRFLSLFDSRGLKDLLKELSKNQAPMDDGLFNVLWILFTAEEGEDVGESLSVLEVADLELYRDNQWFKEILTEIKNYQKAPEVKQRIQDVIDNKPKPQPQITQIEPQISQIKPQISQIKSQARPIYTQESEWKKIAEDEEKLGKSIGGIAVDPENNFIYVPNVKKESVATIIKSDGTIDTLPIKVIFPYACSITKKHIFVATEQGIRVFDKNTKQLDTSLVDNGIIKGYDFVPLRFDGVAVREVKDGYEVFGTYRAQNKILKYNKTNKYKLPVQETTLDDPRGLTFTRDGKLLVTYNYNICIVNPDTIKIEYDSGYMDELYNSYQAIEDKNGYIYVTASGKVVIFKRDEKDKKLAKIGELKNPNIRGPYGIAIREDELIIAPEGEEDRISSIWAVLPARQADRIKPQTEPIYTQELEWEKIAEDEKILGDDIGSIAGDFNKDELYVASGSKGTVRVIDKNGNISEDRKINIRKIIFSCYVTKSHIFIGTEDGLYIFEKNTFKRDKKLFKNGGIFMDNRACLDVVVREINDNYELFLIWAGSNCVYKYDKSNNYTEPVGEYDFGFFPPARMGFTKDGKLLVTCSDIYILDPEKMILEESSREKDPVLKGAEAVAEDDNGYLYAAYNLREIRIFRRSKKKDKEGLKKLIRAGRKLIHPEGLIMKDLVIMGGKIIIACDGPEKQPSSIWAVKPKPQITQIKLQQGGNKDAYFAEMAQEEVNPQIKRILEDPAGKDFYFVKGASDEGRAGELEIKEEYKKFILDTFENIVKDQPELKDYGIVVLRGVNFSGHYGTSRNRIYIPLEILELNTYNLPLKTILEDFIEHEYLHTLGLGEEEILDISNKNRPGVYEEARKLYREYIASKLVEAVGEYKDTELLKLKLERILARVQENKKIELTETQLHRLLWLIDKSKDLNIVTEIAQLIDLILEPNYTGDPGQVVMAVEKEILEWLDEGRNDMVKHMTEQEAKKLLKVHRTFTNEISFQGPSIQKNVKDTVTYIDKFTVPKPVKLEKPSYVLIDEFRAERYQDIIKEITQKWNVNFITELTQNINPKDVLVLVDPEDADEAVWEGKGFKLYLPLIYGKTSLILAAELSSTDLKDDNDLINTEAYKFAKGFYETLLNTELEDTDVISWFKTPWLLKGKLSSITQDLKFLRIAVEQLDKSA